MLLETRKVRKNDFIIYSRNSTDDEYNFRIIFRNDPKLSVRKIDYEQVKRLINEYFPKNLIVYRILTNIPELSLKKSDHGIVITVEDETELFFTDPVYAIKTVENILDNHSFELFRFKIQQVGLTALRSSNNLTVYKEKVSYDLKAKEAISFNDEILAHELLEYKQVRPSKRKKSDSDTYIFIPENLKDFVDVEAQKLALGKEDIILKSERIYRGERIPDSDTSFAGKKLPLEVNRRKSSDDKISSSVKDDFLNRKEENDFVAGHEREKQQSLRDKSVENISLPENKTYGEKHFGLQEVKSEKIGDMKKIKSKKPIQIRKVKINNDNSIEEISFEPVSGKGDKLFRRFLESVKSESDSNIRRKRKKRRDDSDVIHLFKSLQKRDILKNKKNEDVILKINKGKKK